MKEKDLYELAFQKVRDAERVCLAGECLGAMKADLIFPRLCWMLLSEGKRLTVCRSDLEEYRQLAEDPGAGEATRIFAGRCLDRIWNLEEQDCLEIRDKPFSGKEENRVLILMDRERIPEWAAGAGPLTMMEIEDNGRLKILSQKGGGNLFSSSEKNKEKITGALAERLGRIGDQLAEWILGDDF